MAATNHSALSSDETRSAETRSDEVSDVNSREVVVDVSVGVGGFVGCLRHMQVHDATVDVARGGVTSDMTRSGVTTGDCDVTLVTWCHRPPPRTCPPHAARCPRDQCDCSDTKRRKFCLFCKPPCNHIGCDYFAPGRTANYCDEYFCSFVCLSLCLSARVTLKPHS